MLTSLAPRGSIELLTANSREAYKDAHMHALLRPNNPAQRKCPQIENSDHTGIPWK
ncbi:hypothetical protein CC1G_10049 [Coprinopsis cinerea okayama7|uniref:Uncharacterized protein n=1 Tax=Coprinopsis cinerea (strain Okayama-7 / 130 / ATCC MYA-4618 / FGSC 9003) TaxID=240176 RepID=A8NUX5_COPC7|nr:hypothetical protein CC1G_10049 [Coprinopsis cinerea okayama7\|eukprot:XP_001836555.2 hypothetical protein CC1G_10049 [Coprinopsis cinerea okayama7\